MEMPKLLFFIRYDNRKGTGRLTKFDGQIAAAKRLGLDVYYTACDNKYIYLVHNNDRMELRRKAFSRRIPILSEIDEYHALYMATKNIKKYYKIHFSYCYIRMMYATPGFIYAIKRLHDADTKNIIEIPTYPHVREIEAMKNGIVKEMLTVSMRGEKYLAKYVDLFALIGDKSNGTYLSKPSVNIENGIDVENIPLRHHASGLNNEIHLLALASMNYWHGYDRLIEGIFNYYIDSQDYSIVLHMVGPEGDGSLVEWRALAKKRGIEQHVKIEGVLYGTKLEHMVNLCDVGIASLGLHRSGFASSSILKIREYFARGLPFIYATSDESLRENSIEKYCLKVPNDDSAIDMKAVIAFIKRARMEKLLSEQMRQFAVSNLSWDRQFSKIFNRLESCH